MAYASPSDALHCLLTGKERSAMGAHCWISSMPSEVRQNRAGIEECAVEVTCSTGAQFQIQAMGDEAIELFAMAARSRTAPFAVPAMGK